MANDLYGTSKVFRVIELTLYEKRIRMARQNTIFVGRPATAQRQSWHKTEWIDGILTDVTPAPGRTFTHETYPPRGRGRGESLTSPRRVAAKLRTSQVIRMRGQGRTWQEIARELGFKDASGPYRAYKRAIDRVDWNARRRQELKCYGSGV